MVKNHALAVTIFTYEEISYSCEDFPHMQSWENVTRCQVEDKTKLLVFDAVLPLGLSGRRGIVVACVCPSVRLSVRKLYLVRTITRHKFELELPNLHQTCIMGYSRLVLKIEVIDLDLQNLQGHFGHFDSEF